MTIVRSVILEYSYVSLIILGLVEVISDFKFWSLALGFIKKNCVWVLVGLGLFPLVIFGVYFYGAGLPGSDKNWTLFGTMAAGCFTGMAAFFTLATLVHLIKQKKAEDTLRTFELYRKHKEEFYSVLQMIEKTFSNKITFSNPDYLYANIFQENTIENVMLSMGMAKYKRTPFFSFVVSPLEQIKKDVVDYEIRIKRHQYSGLLHEKHARGLTQRVDFILSNFLGVQVLGAPKGIESGFILEKKNRVLLPGFFGKNYLAFQRLVEIIQGFAVAGATGTIQLCNEFSNPCLIHQFFLLHTSKYTFFSKKDSNLMTLNALRKNAFAFSLMANLAKDYHLDEMTINGALDSLRCGGLHDSFSFDADKLKSQYREFEQWLPSTYFEVNGFRREFDKKLEELLSNA